MAIATGVFSSNIGGSVGTGTVTASQTVPSGGSLFAIVQWNRGGTALSTDISGVTADGSAMTRLTGANVHRGSWGSSIWFIAAPTTGSAINIIATGGSASVGSLAVSAHSYTGVSATQPDSASSANGTNNGANISATTTVVAPDCWLLTGYASADDGNPDGVNITRRTLPAQQFASADSNGTVATGSQSATWSQVGSGGDVIVSIVSIAPAVAVTFIPRIMMS